MKDKSALEKLYSRVSELEQSIKNLTKQNQKSTDRLNEIYEENEILKKKVTKLESSKSELKDTVENLQKREEENRDALYNMKSKIRNIREDVNLAQGELTEQSFHTEKKNASLRKRVSGIENELGLEEWESVSRTSPDACALERFSDIPKDKRNEELKTPVSRATSVWENFDEWSSPTHKGRIIRSGELKKLLKASLGDNLAWTQIYRVMKEFDENSPEDYTYIDNKSGGKMLIRLRKGHTSSDSHLEETSKKDLDDSSSKLFL